MINALIYGISNALYAEFGYENHMEEIRQDLQEPCFFISCLNPTTRLFLGKRYFRQNEFCIQYFPETGEIQRECNDVAERMLWCLEYITAEENQIRGTRMKYEIVDGVLNFFVNYDCFVYRRQEETPMEAFETATGGKEGE